MKARTAPLVVALALAAPVASATVISAVRVVHDDFNGVVVAGESVTFRVLVSWDGAGDVQFAGLRGDTRATPDLGSVSNVQSAFFLAGPPLNTLGTATAGSVINTDIAVVPAALSGGVAQPGTMNSTGMELISWTWTAPSLVSPQVVNFDFTTYAIAPNARFYVGAGTTNFVEAQTFFLDTSILVLPVPAPASAGLLAMGLVAAGRRRR